MTKKEKEIKDFVQKRLKETKEILKGMHEFTEEKIAYLLHMNDLVDILDILIAGEELE